MLGKKTNRLHIRVTDETRITWLKLCEELSGATQSQVFRNLIEKVANETEAAIKSGENTINEDNNGIKS